jgi:hypothetical protein
MSRIIFKHVSLDMWRAKKQVNYKQFLWQIKEASSKKDFPLHPRPLFPKTHHFPRYQIAIAKLIYSKRLASFNSSSNSSSIHAIQGYTRSYTSI